MKSAAQGCRSEDAHSGWTPRLLFSPSIIFRSLSGSPGHHLSYFPFPQGILSSTQHVESPKLGYLQLKALNSCHQLYDLGHKGNTVSSSVLCSNLTTVKTELHTSYHSQIKGQILKT